MARAMASPGGDAAIPNPDPDTPATFHDVTAANERAWCYRYAEFCAANAVVQGYWDNAYRPAGEVRDQMAVYVARAFELAP